ncbi:MAG TPA: ORF6N domain-containing protein [Candidatus Deferrimicrobiaceae bacterium]|jgi:hypothetical protein
METGNDLVLIMRKIVVIRGHRVMVDADLAELYGVPTFRLNEAVKRNPDRFPDDFMLQLTIDEHAALTSQIAMSKPGRGGRRTLPYVFTEQGVAMLSSVLRTDRAVQVNIAIMRAFVAVRQTLATNRSLARKLEDLERKYDARFKIVFDAIRALMTSPDPPSRKIGFSISPRRSTARCVTRLRKCRPDRRIVSRCCRPSSPSP